nr:CbiQ family ECF transporter T component [Pseudoclavibacter chungangensis]
MHRAPAGVKLAALAVLAVGSSVLPWAPWPTVVAGVVAIVGYLVAGLGIGGLVEQVLAARWVIVLLVGTQMLFLPLATALTGTARVLVVLLLAALVTCTTSTGEMLEVVDRVLGPFRRFGVDPVRVGLVLALTIATIPVLQGFAAQIREAQRARGVRVPPVRLVVPLLVLSLKHADDVGDALAARGLGDPDSTDETA